MSAHLHTRFGSGGNEGKAAIASLSNVTLAKTLPQADVARILMIGSSARSAAGSVWRTEERERASALCHALASLCLA